MNTPLSVAYRAISRTAASRNNLLWQQNSISRISNRGQRKCAAPRAFSTDTGTGAEMNRIPAVYTAYTVYKAKGAVSFKIIKPTWERTASGIRLSREGTMLLEFATGSGAGDRSYAWGSKGTFGLSASEIGDFLAAADAGEEWSAFHDPNMGGSGRGAVSKSLKLTPAQQGSWFLSLGVRGTTQGSYSVALTRGELRVVTTCLEFALPRCLGLDEQFAGPPSVSDTSSNNFGGGNGGGGGGGMMPPF